MKAKIYQVKQLYFASLYLPVARNLYGQNYRALSRAFDRCYFKE